MLLSLGCEMWNFITARISSWIYVALTIICWKNELVRLPKSLSKGLGTNWAIQLLNYASLRNDIIGWAWRAAMQALNFNKLLKKSRMKVWMGLCILGNSAFYFIFLSLIFIITKSMFIARNFTDWMSLNSCWQCTSFNTIKR